MSTQDKKSATPTGSATTKNVHATKPEKKEALQTTPTDKKAERKEAPDTSRTTMNTDKDRTDRKDTK